MTFHFFFCHFSLSPRPLAKFPLSQLLCLALFSFFMSIQPAHANEASEESFTTEFEVLSEDKLPEYVSKMSQRYYDQVALLGKYFQIYQQKRDPRGFNVWHLRGFSPNYTMLNNENQLVAQANKEFLAERPEQALTTLFAELQEVSFNLLVAFRDNDPEAFKSANAKIKAHTVQIAALLKAHQLESEIREVSLN